MPFGKYKGVPLSALPGSYLDWLISLGPSLRHPLRGAVLAEVASRVAGNAEHDVRHPPPRRDLVEELVGAGLRSLARKHHPDIGGDTRTMQELNHAADWLRQVVKGAPR